MNGCKYLRICALLVSISSLRLPLEAANVVFVGDVDMDGMGDGEVPEYAAADVSMINHMTNVLGHSVVSVDDSLATATAVAGADFIVLSATAASGAYATNGSGDGNSGATNSLATNATIILMESGNAIQVAFGLAGATIGPVIGTDIEIVELDGYLTNGFDAGTISIYDNPEFGGEEIRTFGVKPPNGTNAGFPQFDWTGDVLLGISATTFEPVVLGTHRIGDNLIVAFPFGLGGFDHLTADGLQLFNNAFSPPSVTGDYNEDGVVDAADYTVWRDTNGSTTDLRANGDDTGGSMDQIDQADYDVWVANFGTPGGFGAVTSVPEPAAAILAIVGAALLGAWRSARRVFLRSVVSN